MKILVVDNYDSFTYNLVDMLSYLSGSEVRVVMNDKVTLDSAGQFDRIVISPGPGIPAEAGNTMKLIAEFAPKIPILGVCLGHQAIAEVFGGSLINVSEVFHGISTPLKFVDPGDPLLKGIVAGDEVGRYHSWVVNPAELPTTLQVTATDANDIIMAMRHISFPLHSVQFHPESVLTPCGEKIIQNWLSL